MVGQGALRECLLDSGVETGVTVYRRATGQRHEKLRELIHEDLLDLSAVEPDLAGFDACVFCLGVSSAGMSKKAQARRYVRHEARRRRDARAAQSRG